MALSNEPEALAPGRPQARLQVVRELLSRPGALAQRLPDLAPQFPFRLGEGSRDWALPFAFDDRLAALGQAAVEELFELLSDRRPAATEPALAVRYGLRRALQPWTIRLAASASELDPQLDPSLISAWCDRSAGPLGDGLKAAFGRALEAELLGETPAPYGAMLALACGTFAEAQKALVRSRTIRGVAYERTEKALGFAFFALIELSAQRAIRELERHPRSAELQPASERIRLCLNPLSYCAIRSRALQNGLNPWWLSDALDDLWIARRAEDLLGRPLDQMMQLALDQVLAEPQVRAKYARAGRQARLRHALLRLLWEHDRSSDDIWSQLRPALASDDRLAELQGDARATLQRIAAAGASPKAVQGLQAALLPGGPDLEDLQLSLTAQLAFAIDRLLAEHTDRMAKTLRDVRSEARGAVAPGVEIDTRPIQQLYEQGRLYRFSGDPKPILQAATKRLTGHLFVDLKGFTQRTVRAKEIVVADFLRREFYEPILRAAGALNILGGAEVQLLNLVGDAAAFAGEVPALVSLAVDIRRICNAYQRTLAGSDPGSGAAEADRYQRELQQRLALVEEPILLESSLLQEEIARKESLDAVGREAELTRQLQQRAADLARAHAEVRDRLAEASAEARPALEAQMLHLSEAEEQLAESGRSTLQRLAPSPAKIRADAILDLITTRERQRLEELGKTLRQAREQVQREVAQRRRLRSTATGQGSGLEAGVFISHGSAPEDVQIQDPVFGEVRVAVAEKLNEAARGTGRSSKVAEEVAHALRQAMGRSGNPQLRDPFAVHLGAGEGSGDAGGEVATEIFNAGEALSGEALHQFLQETVRHRYHFAKWVRRSDLAPEITDQLAFPDRTRLIVSLATDGSLSDALLFRSVGFVRFRGFEESEACDVYELISPEQRLNRLLAQHHLAAWAAEARATPKQLLSGLPGR